MTNEPKQSKFGLYSSLGIGALAIGCSIAAIPFLTPAMRKHALPYIPATPKQIKNVFKAIRQYSAQNNIANKVPNNSNLVKLVDLGSGDGRIVFDAAKRGYHATGVELNAILVLYSKIKAITSRSQLKPKNDLKFYKPQFERADFWKVNMNEYDLIVVFGVQEMMKDLGKKLKLEMKEDTLIVSCRNPIPSYKSVFSLDDELDSVWIYNKESLFKLVESENKANSNKKVDDDDDDDD